MCVFVCIWQRHGRLVLYRDAARLLVVASIFT